VVAVHMQADVILLLKYGVCLPTHTDAAPLCVPFLAVVMQ
jgi:hypothetical protein